MSVIDISSKISSEKPRIKLAEGKVYEVDNGADNFLLIQQKIKDQDFSIDVMYQIIEMTMGKKALEDIKKMNPSIPNLEAIVTGIMAAVNEEPLEVMEERFRKSKQS